nr:hypothetical protein [uncultured Anaerotignum sp.]
MIQKLKNTAGETFIEALAALLIMGLSTVLFLGLVNAANHVNRTQKETDARFFAAMKQVEVLSGGTEKEINVKILKNGTTLETIKCRLTEAENLRAYEIKP